MSQGRSVTQASAVTGLVVSNSVRFARERFVFVGVAPYPVESVDALPYVHGMKRVGDVPPRRRVSSVMNMGSTIAVDCGRVVDLQRDSENLADTSSVTGEILQQPPFSTAC